MSHDPFKFFEKFIRNLNQYNHKKTSLLHNSVFLKSIKTCVFEYKVVSVANFYIEKIIIWIFLTF